LSAFVVKKVFTTKYHEGFHKVTQREYSWCAFVMNFERLCGEESFYHKVSRRISQSNSKGIFLVSLCDEL